jgi:hypothetical protein
MEKLLDKIEILHKAVNNLASLGVISEQQIKDISEGGLNKLINKEQMILRNDAFSYFAELDDQNK